MFSVCALGRSTPRQIPVMPPKMRNTIRTLIAIGNCDNFCRNAIKMSLLVVGVASNNETISFRCFSFQLINVSNFYVIGNDKAYNL